MIWHRKVSELGGGQRDNPKRVPGLKQDLNTQWEAWRDAGVKPDVQDASASCMYTLRSAVRQTARNQNETSLEASG